MAYQSTSTNMVKRHKIIIGLDYGTTYSGVSFVTSDKSGLENVVMIDKWPNCGPFEPKAPTRIAYANENRGKITEDRWGFNATLGLESYSWTKLLLGKEASRSSYDDPKLQAQLDSGLIRLPPNKSASDVCRDYLTGLYEYTVERIKKHIESDVFEASPVECWVTVPAIWSPKAQLATEKAAREAGFGSRPGDSVRVIPEPQAAALAALKPYTRPGAFDAIQPNESILICDCGGGTVDITTYTITKTNPLMEFEVLCLGRGDMCGSTCIDRKFSDWMVEKFGQAFTNVPIKDRDPGSKFMHCFESCKKRFDTTDHQQSFEIWPIRMSTQSPKYDDEEGSVKLSYKEMKNLFDPTVKQIVRLVESQIDDARRSKQRSINRLILVGGFGESMYLYKSLKRCCEQNGSIRLICPPNCQSAIARGAALRGLEGTKPRKTYARFHYGYGTNLPFREGIDNEKDAGINPYSGEKFCYNRIKWFLGKGESIEGSKEFTFFLLQDIFEGHALYSQLRLYTTAQDVAPDWRADHTVEEGRVITKFEYRDIAEAGSRWNPKHKKAVRRFEYEVSAILQTENSSLSFKTYAYGKEAGRATFWMDLELI